MNFRNVFKKNQMMIYAMAFMLVVAGYFNYTSNVNENDIETTSVQEVSSGGDISDAVSEEKTDESDKEKSGDKSNKIEQNNEKVAEIGDATLVNSNDVVKDDYFAKSKIERDAMYSQMKETYETILNSPNSLESQKEMASVEMAKINETKNCIMICENLLETKGFKDCVIFVNDGSVSVIVGGKELKQEQTAQIQNIITRELGAIVENIHISVK
ncbi:MAG: SpoIIIAH-like family protein [Clostridia bacterium]|nr:SpoIIIAH-like family protein [Clostridia bacterium]